MKYIKYFEEDNIRNNYQTIIVKESDKKGTWTEGNQLYCGNIFYHGSLIFGLTLEDIKNYIKKSDYKTYEWGNKIALYLFPDLYNAFYWSVGRFKQKFFRSGKFENIFVNLDKKYFPTTYKIIIKPNSKFIYIDEDVDVSIDEKDFYLKNNLIGSHSGEKIVPGTASPEITIVNPESILKIEQYDPNKIQVLANKDITKYKSPYMTEYSNYNHLIYSYVSKHDLNNNPKFHLDNYNNLGQEYFKYIGW